MTNSIEAVRNLRDDQTTLLAWHRANKASESYDADKHRKAQRKFDRAALEIDLSQVLKELEGAEQLRSENADLTHDVEAYHSDALLVMKERNRLLEALKPSCETKAAYMGEFKFPVAGHSSDVHVPWTTIKEIMAAILERAQNQGAQP